MGMPLLLGMGFEYIDPMAFDDPVTGKRLLYWSLGFQPIKVQELAEDRMSFTPDSEPIDLAWPNPVKGQFPRLVEATWVIRHDDYYYLFYFEDNCCGPDAEYGVMVARSRSATGLFETLEQARGVPHSLMLFKSERRLAPGHNLMVTDKVGQVLDHLPRDRREPAAPTAGGRDQQPPDPADRSDRMARRLALRRDSIGGVPDRADDLSGPDFAAWRKLRLGMNQSSDIGVWRQAPRLLTHRVAERQAETGRLWRSMGARALWDDDHP